MAAHPAVGLGRRRPAAAGVVAAALALGVGELVAGLLPGAGSPVVSVGNAVIDAVPAPVKDLAISIFGLADKIALVVGIVLFAAAFGALLGVVGARRFAAAAAGFVAFGAIGVAAAGSDPQTSLVATAVAVTVAVAIGVLGLRRLLAAARAARMAPDVRPDARPDVAIAMPDDATSAPGVSGDRRAFLRLTGGLVAVAAASAAGGRWLSQQAGVAASRAALVLPQPVRRADAPPAGADLGIDGVVPFVTPNERFYRIDTALVVPRVDVDSWRLQVTGMVDRPLELTFDELAAMGTEEHWTTLCCVSNEVGGGLIGNALWSGVPLRRVLERAGTDAAASQIVGRSVDGFTAGFPTSAAYDGRAALLAVAMNGEPLPVEHGFPVRLVVPGLYGYVSATKWLSQLELTTLDAFDGYWIPRGWSKRGPIKTQSRIDVPATGARVAAGRTPVAGVAWAQASGGVRAVEVQIDEQPWAEARLGTALNDDTWRQWVYEWEAPPGHHVVRVRATDNEGTTQTGRRRPVAPDGATGWHEIRVEVER
jgi:DMSO/TMAO reductase YedYZ molybdopterin-dependent catalytic subunit